MTTFTRPLADPPFNSNPSAIPGVTNLQAIIGYAAWGATAVCLIGLIAAGAMMAVSHSRGQTEHMGRLGSVTAGCVIVGAASQIVSAILGFNLFTADATAIPGLGMVQTIIGYTSWVAAAVCLIGLIAAGAMMTISHNRGQSDNMGRLGSVATGCLIVGGAATIVGALI